MSHLAFTTRTEVGRSNYTLGTAFPYTIHSLKDFPTQNFTEAIMTINGHELEVEDSYSERVLYAVQRSAAMIRAGYPVDCGGFASLLAGATSYLPTTRVDTLKHWLIRSDVIVENPDQTASTLDQIAQAGNVIAWTNTEDSNHPYRHFTEGAPIEFWGKELVLGKMGFAGNIGLTDVNTLKIMYNTDAFRTVDALTVHTKDFDLIQYTRNISQAA